MEPIVLLGLIVVAYAGAVSVQDLLRDLSITVPRRKPFATVSGRDASRGLQARGKQVAGVHI